MSGRAPYARLDLVIVRLDLTSPYINTLYFVNA